MVGLDARRWGLAVLSGLLQVVPFPIAGPVPVWRTVFCWFCLVPLLLAILGWRGKHESASVWRGAVLGYACGFTWYLGNCYWIYQTMYLYGGLARPVAAGILLLFCLYLGLYHAVFGAFVAFIGRSEWRRQGALFLVPVAWVAVELARSRITGFPWDLLGVAQVDNGFLTKLASVTGVFGMSFAIATVNALWLLRIEVRERRYTRMALTAMGVALVVLWVGLLRLPATQPERGTGTATLLQENLEVGAANVGPQMTPGEMLTRFSELSARPARFTLRGMPEVPGRPMMAIAAPQQRSELIVWPESPAPFEQQDAGFRTAMSSLAQGLQAPVIVGNIGIDPAANGPGAAPGGGTPKSVLHNSAMFVRPDGAVEGRYDKMHLVPFGEYVPYKRLFFFAGNLLAEVGSFDPGGKRMSFAVNGHHYGTFICYESIFGDEVREFVRDGADVLVNISNDGWYGDTSAPWQHLNMVRMRAIENHRWVLRSTNTGVTAAIDPEGRVRASAPRHVRTAIRVNFGYEHDLTFYSKHGDWFAYLCAAVVLGVIGWEMAAPRRVRQG